VILISLKEGQAPTADYERRLRETLPVAFPSVTFYFQAADITTQILNFGLPAQIDVRVVGRDRGANLHVAHELRRRIAGIPGGADAHLQQELNAPAFMVNIDRARALELGLNAQAVVNDLNTSLSSSEQIAPNFWTDPANGIPYYIAVQTPEPLVSSLGELSATPVSTQIAANGPPIPGLLSNVATLQRDTVPTNLNQTNIQPVYDVYASAQDRDLGGVSEDIGKIVAELQTQLKPGNTIQVLGQIQSMQDSFRDLGVGLFPELPNREFPGKVTRIADAEQSGTRTLLTEIDLPNPQGALRSGVYCFVELEIPRKAPSFIVPSEAITFNRKGLQVAVVQDGKAKIRKVRVTRDMGARVEVDGGVKQGDRVILNPPVNLAAGSDVRLAAQ
jgi:multidrug efflux pump subunit AcrA (membrane-fusion protein)